MIYAIILAGGRGERFWPLSTLKRPKQFLRLCSQESFFIETLRRIKPLVIPKNIYVSTSVDYKRVVFRSVRNFKIPLRNILLEPVPRNTLAPVAFLTKHIFSINPQAVVIILPSDHLIYNTNRFVKELKQAVSLAEDGYIVTLGARPTRPETGYGYIKSGKKLDRAFKAFQVSRFIEKPNKQKAIRLSNKKGVFWNCGIFIFQAKVFLEELRKYAPEVFRKLYSPGTLKELWNRLPALSIDYALIEHTLCAAVIPIKHNWSDIGSWLSVYEILPKDKCGNHFRGKVVGIDTQDTLIWIDKGKLAALGLRDLLVIKNKENILICAKDKAQEVKKAVSLLSQD